MGKAYGFFEIPSVTAAVVAMDIMCKTADVAVGYMGEKIRWKTCHDHNSWRCIRSCAGH